jgi:hypothetical protein
MERIEEIKNFEICHSSGLHHQDREKVPSLSSL